MTERTEKAVFIVAAVAVITMNILMAVVNTWPKKQEKKETPIREVEVIEIPAKD